MPTEDELFNLILERYELDEFLEVCGCTLRDFLVAWDGWVGNPAVLEDLGFVDDEENFEEEA